MSHLGAAQHIRGSASPGSLKRKRETPTFVRQRELPDVIATGRHHPSEVGPSAADPNHALSAAANGTHVSKFTSPDSDDMPVVENGDLLRGVGSASSLGSAASSVFTHTSQSHDRRISHAHNLTPLTNPTESSPPKGNSPQPAKVDFGSGLIPIASSTSNEHVTADSSADIPSHEPRPQLLPPTGKAKGYRAVWDPEMDGKLSKEERKRAVVKKREFGTETHEMDPPPDPRLAIPGYMSGNCRSKNAPSKAILRIAPYNLPPYKLDRNSVGPGEAQQVVVTGFDPFLPESTLRAHFAPTGSIASVQNKTDPETGGFLGVALIKFRDSTRDTGSVMATAAAKRAESELNGHRIGLRTIRVELDREGRRCKRHVENVLKKSRDARAKEQKALAPIASNGAPSTPESAKPSKDSPAPPPNAPKGPSGKTSTKSATKPPDGPRATTAQNGKHGTAALVEEEPILSKIKRKPYIHIPGDSVPVLGTTIPHLKKRLKAYDWREVRLDKTGYYVVFEDSKRGEDETERCFTECNDGALFTYKMIMECQKYGNPDYERSPSPERAMAEAQMRAEYQRLQEEEAADLEIEKKNRAENLDPVLGALEQLRAELRDKIMGDVKTRIAIPIFHDSLDPAKHFAKRRKLGLPDPSDNESKAPGLLFNRSLDPFSSGPKSRLLHAKPLRPHDPLSQRNRKGDRDKGSTNVFADERRRRPTAKPAHARGLHFRLQQMYAEEEDSDEEGPTSARDTEDQESRPRSRTSRTSTPFDNESVTAETPHKRRKVSEWEDEEKETFDAFHKEMLGHLLHKEPEDLATRELDLVVNTLPRASKYATRARTELFIRQRSKADDDLFQINTDVVKEINDTSKDVQPTAESVAKIATAVTTKPVKEKPKRKRRTKKQIQEEQEVLKAAAAQAAALSEPVIEEPIAVVEHQEAELDDAGNEDSDIEMRSTFDKPRPVVEEKYPIVLDVEGWQELIKDDEDLAFAKLALDGVTARDIGNASYWAWKQKEIKALNSTLITGGSAPTALIQGYYVPNSSGCARTEGVKKILNEEKSKYLPHRIRVQRAREERQAFAKANPSAAAEAAKIAAAEKIASTAASRSNRVNNRRLVNDINLQKQSLATGNTDIDVTIRFNQLKKRKKLVKFDRSAIHGWGLYAEENIAINDLIIEYVGEKVRQKVADMRELRYEKQGVGSSYLFRMLDDEIVDATKKGGIARFINHSCNPNCTAKIIKVEGTPRIVIYALKDIYKNEELTYDYKFEREYGSTDRIPCLCGSANCKGFLN